MDNLQLSSRHGQRPFQGAPLNPSSASVGVAGFSQVEMRGLIYNSVDFGTGKSLVSSDWRSQINGGRARILMSQKSREKGGGGGGQDRGVEGEPLAVEFNQLLCQSFLRLHTRDFPERGSGVPPVFRNETRSM